MELTEADKAILREAVKAVEARSRAEVVLCVRPRSAVYDRGPLLLGAAVAWVFLGFQLLSPWEFPLDAILLEPPIVGAGVAFLGAAVPWLERRLASRKRRRAAVEQAARATFQERGVGLTRERTGVLVYVSLLEREAIIVADKCVTDVVPPETWSDSVARIEAAVREGRAAALAEAVRALGEPLSVELPPRADDVDELPDYQEATE
jgi:putative membrane protein